MASRGSALSRAIEFFRTANLDEARVAFQLASEVMDERLTVAATPEPAAAKVRKPRTRKPKADGAVSASNENESLASA